MVSVREIFGHDQRKDYEIEGKKYIQGKIATLWLKASSLSSSTNVDAEDGIKTRSLVGTARLDKDRLSVAGFKAAEGADKDDRAPQTKEIPFYINPVNKEKNSKGDFKDWVCSIGFMEADWEIGNDDSWYLSVLVPVEAYNELNALFEAGKLGSISMGLKTDLLVESFDDHAPPSVGVTWYLKPGKYGYDPAHGKMTHLRWQTTETKFSEPSPEFKDELEATPEGKDEPTLSKGAASPFEREAIVIYRKIAKNLVWLAWGVVGIFLILAFK